MKKSTFTVSEVPGSSRTSHRNYTHALIGEFNYDQKLSYVSKISDNDKSNFDYSKRCSECVPGERYNRKDFNFEVDEKMIENGKAVVAEHGNRDQYAINLRDKRVKETMEAKAKFEGIPGVLRWSQSFANANKNWKEFSYCKNLRVVETKIITK